MITMEMTALQQAIDEESWEWLQDNYPQLARALEAEVKRGATAEDIRRFTMRYTGRPALALRLEQAAGHLRGVG